MRKLTFYRVTGVLFLVLSVFALFFNPGIDAVFAAFVAYLTFKLDEYEKAIESFAERTEMMDKHRRNIEEALTTILGIFTRKGGD